MKIRLVSVFMLFSFAVAGYAPAKVPLTTKWGKLVTPGNAWQEYPRPHLIRSNWQNLNGLWQYAVTKRSDGRPAQWTGKILVPFALESSLSGVGRWLEPNEQLWYCRTFEAKFDRTKERLLLHFGGVDFRTQVFVNGAEVTDVPHESGNLPFTLDVSDFVKAGSNELVVSVWDQTNRGFFASGKQTLKPAGCMYTRSSGIWQTVWLERVPATCITGYKVVTDIDKGTVAVRLTGKGDLLNATGSVTILYKGKKIASAPVTAWGKPVLLTVRNPKLWSPDSPELYDLQLTLKGKNSAEDTVKGYFGMRKIEWKKEEKGVASLYLNHRKIYMLGILDQGWWPESLLTPPSDEAMKFDINMMKACGFNTLRKHAKIEPLRFYYWCDKLGILVWQDMPPGWGDAELRYTYYRHELKGMLDLLQTFPSIVMWVPYNENWGQPEAAKTNMTIRWIKRYDPTRLVDGPSGWKDYSCGDARDVHYYPGPQMTPAMAHRLSVLGEFGGISCPVNDHVWSGKKWGYAEADSLAAFGEKYQKLMEKLSPLAAQGLAASIYTQATDVEIEINGLMTYDREVVKVPPEKLRRIHQKVYDAAASR